MKSLRRRMTEDMQVRGLSPQTQATYVQQVSLFARHFNRSPELLGPEEIRSYQLYLCQCGRFHAQGEGLSGGHAQPTNKQSR